ncbi:rhodanese-like domain-containing protein [Leucobacter luti]|uniref:rhodanese-like domain-containing protein n=1 Tax=Leucobacter luti TaxID=340320 RepID=UPI001C6933D5|nr:rhodanese-like domain-containing protein [Leucobacter luti]QYM76679.1 rhodanese-like domain-containing protein [Leucobacter luti]
MRLIDVRSAAEHAERRVRGSDWLPVEEIEAGAAVIGPVVLYCERDPRSVRAATALRRSGTVSVSYLRGGIDAFARFAPDLVDRGQRQE